jgi:hypothetical protein
MGLGRSALLCSFPLHVHGGYPFGIPNDVYYVSRQKVDWSTEITSRTRTCSLYSNPDIPRRDARVDSSGTTIRRSSPQGAHTYKVHPTLRLMLSNLVLLPRHTSILGPHSLPKGIQTTDCELFR